MSERPIGIDVFAGAGGLSLGFEQAGFDVLAAVEVDPIHTATHKFNFPYCSVLTRSVLGLTGQAIRGAANIGERPIDVVFGGAPCQGFSLIGHRALDDPRNLLVKEFVRIVAELSPSYFVFENVKGLTVGRHKAFLEELITAFETTGYSVRLPWKVLNSANFHVPQDRKRLFLFGAKRGLTLPEYPGERCQPAGSASNLFNLPEGPSCDDAVSDLPNAEEFDSLLAADAVWTTRWGNPSFYSRALRCTDKSSWFKGYKRQWDPLMLTSSLRTVHSEISRRRFAETKGGEVEPISRFFKLPANGVSNTLRAGTDSARGAFTSPRPIHFRFPRCITVREMARLHGFPDWFRFHVTKWHGARQIGNAVPPPLAKVIAEQIVNAIGCRIENPSRILELGDPSLLAMDMSAAATFWGVENPIRRRDRKSGAKKRKQLEIELERLSRIAA